MSEGVFNDGYAAAYDHLYEEKDYEQECDLICALLNERGVDGSAALLDLGCGTGGHAIPLARRGHLVVGVDRSRPMLARAKEKAAALGEASGLRFVHGDVQTADLGRTFDAVLLMFAVLGYQATEHELNATLRTVASHLRPGGLFLFDVWYGPAVLAVRPEPRRRTVKLEGEERLIREAAAELDPARNLCTVRYLLRHLNRAGELRSETREQHTMRYFDQQELESTLGAAGLGLLSLRGFPDLDSAPSLTTWNVLGVAERLAP